MKSIEYVTIENNIITSHRCGSEPEEKKGITIIEVSNWPGLIGSDIRMYQDTRTWSMRPLKELVKDNLTVIPSGQKLSDDGLAFIPMSEIELIEAGLKELPPYQKIEAGQIIYKN